MERIYHKVRTQAPFYLPFILFMSLGACRSASTGNNENSLNSPSDLSSEQEAKHCLSEHLQEAINLNIERRPLYADLSNNKSLPISDELIKAEKSLLNLVKPLAPLLKTWWDSGIYIGCLEFSSMSLTPEFRASFEKPAPSVERNGVKWLDPFGVKLRLHQALLVKGFAAVEQLAHDEIKNLQYPSHYQCMSRHILESIIKSSRVAHELTKLAEAQGKPSPAPISLILIQGHIMNLSEAVKMDKDSFLLHRQGIPIICNDVPPIE